MRARFDRIMRRLAPSWDAQHWHHRHTWHTAVDPATSVGKTCIVTFRRCNHNGLLVLIRHRILVGCESCGPGGNHLDCDCDCHD